MRGDVCRVAIVGRPNVGKSSFLNTVVGKPLSLVHDAPGTTRDVVDMTAMVAAKLVKEIARLGGDVTRFVTPAVKSALDSRFG